MSKAGRKSKYDYSDKTLLLEIEGLARDGYDDKQIAEHLGLKPGSFANIKNKLNELNEAIVRGRRPLNVLVENSWYKRIIGLKTTTETIQYGYDDNGNEKLLFKTVTINEIPPDASAAKNWLMQRKPEIWNKQPNKVAATDPTGEKAAPLLFLSADSLTEDQIQEYIKKNIEPDEN